MFLNLHMVFSVFLFDVIGLVPSALFFPAKQFSKMSCD